MSDRGRVHHGYGVGRGGAQVATCLQPTWCSQRSHPAKFLVSVFHQYTEMEVGVCRIMHYQLLHEVMH